jgi:hypothetical protein
MAHRLTLSDDFSLAGVSKMEPKEVRLSLRLDLEVGEATWARHLCIMFIREY